MSITVDSIVEEAFNAVALAVSGVIKDATLSKVVKAAYTPSTDTYSETTTESSCRLVFDVSDAAFDIFPGYVAGASDKAAYIQSASVAPSENDTIAVGSESYVVIASSDIAGAGSFYGVVLR
ncbi:MAG: hypothetical protein P1U50_01100 [Parvibaculaceae bacterium]|nr:hypothetical protein [Parvibaculaceae bacterium]